MKALNQLTKHRHLPCFKQVSFTLKTSQLSVWLADNASFSRLQFLKGLSHLIGYCQSTYFVSKTYHLLNKGLAFLLVYPSHSWLVR